MFLQNLFYQVSSLYKGPTKLITMLITLHVKDFGFGCQLWSALDVVKWSEQMFILVLIPDVD